RLRRDQLADRQGLRRLRRRRRRRGRRWRRLDDHPAGDQLLLLRGVRRIDRRQQEQDGGGEESHHQGENGDTPPVQALVLVAVPVKGRGVLRHAGNSILAGRRAPRMLSGSATVFCAGISKLIPILQGSTTARKDRFSGAISAREELARLLRIGQALV